MTERYAVELTESAYAAIAAHARYIAVDEQSPLVAERWLERVWDAVDSLEVWPRRTMIAEEDQFLEVEVRQLVIGSHLLLFTIDDDRRTVWILGLRHGHRLPRPLELPANPAELGEGERE